MLASGREQKHLERIEDDCYHGLAAGCIDRFISVKMARRYPVNSLLKWRKGLNQTDFHSCRTSFEQWRKTWRR